MGFLDKQVSDALSKLGHAHGGFLEGLVMRSPEYQAGPTKIVGPVFTVKFAPKTDATAPKLQGNYVRGLSFWHLGFCPCAIS